MTIVLLLLCTASLLRFSLHLVYGARGPAAGDPLFGTVSVLSWLMFGAASLPLFFSPFLPLAILAVLKLAHDRRESRLQLNQGLLTIAASAPGNALAELFARQRYQFPVTQAMRKLVTLVGGGIPLVEAAHRVPAALPRTAPVALEIGQQIDDPLAGLAETSTKVSPGYAFLSQIAIDRLGLLLAVLLCAATVIPLLLTFIVPSFEQIFLDFELELPLATVFWLQFCRVSSWLGGVFVGLVALAFLTLFLFAVLWLAGIMPSNPLFDWLGRSRHRATALRLLALVVERRGDPLRALSTIANSYPARGVARQAAFARDVAWRGADWLAGLAQSRLVSAREATLLQTASQVGNLGWALRHVADGIQRRSLLRTVTRLQIAQPLVLLFIGLLVGFSVIALFLPLVKMIEVLTEV